MAKPAYYRHKLIQGEDYEVPITLTQPNKQPVDLTGCLATAPIFDLEGNIVSAFNVTIPVPTNGQIILRLSGTANALLFGHYRSPLTLVSSDSSVSYPVISPVVVNPRYA